MESVSCRRRRTKYQGRNLSKPQGQSDLVIPVFGDRNIRHTFSTKPTEKPNGFALFRLAHPGAVPPAPTFAGRRLVRGGCRLENTGIFLKAHYSCNMQAAEQKMLSWIYRRDWDGPSASRMLSTALARPISAGPCPPSFARARFAASAVVCATIHATTICRDRP